MCGRYSMTSSPERLATLFDASEAPAFRDRYVPRFNIAPSTDVVGVVTRRRGRELDLFRWGLVAAGRSLFNVRAEGLAGRGGLGAALAHRRLVLPADGFFEWSPGAGGSQRQPLFFHSPEGTPLALAGLWEEIARHAPGRCPATSATMITTAAGPDLAGVHDRMPVTLGSDALERWLDPSADDLDELEVLLRASPAGTLAHHPVDPRVGDVRNEGAYLVAPYSPPESAPPGGQPLRLFP